MNWLFHLDEYHRRLFVEQTECTSVHSILMLQLVFLLYVHFTVWLCLANVLISNLASIVNQFLGLIILCL